MSKNTQGVEEIFDYNMTVLKDKLQTFDKEHSAAYACDVNTLSNAIKPEDFDEFIAIKTHGNGNCLYNSMSIYLSGK